MNRLNERETIMKTTQLYILFLFSCISSYVLAQPVILTNNERIGLIRISPIHKDLGSIDNYKKGNLKVDNFAEIDEKGNRIFANGKLIQNLNYNTQVVDLPKIDTTTIYGIVDASVKFTPDENILILYAGANPSMNGPSGFFKYNFYNLVHNNVFRTFTDTFTLDRSFHISCDGSTIVSRDSGFGSGLILNIYSLQGEEYVKYVYGPHLSLGYPMISMSGNRVIYKITQSENGIPKWVWIYIDKLQEGWTKETPIDLPVMYLDDHAVSFEIESIANDGKTLILRSDIHDPSNKAYLALIHETEDGWSSPEYVAAFKYQLFSVGLERYARSDIIVHHSEDARVIAVQQTKRFSEFYGTLSYDVDVLIKNNIGEWSMHRINPDGVEVLQSILLSGDGGTLLWNTNAELNVPIYPGLK